MVTKKSHTFWNVLLVITVVVCLLALLSHYKNWTRANADNIQILSGFYYKNLKFSDLDSVVLVDKIPPMERLSGFSVSEKEKGVFREFKDSLTDKKVHVYVDNLSHQKIKLVYHDSLKLFVNWKDSTDTKEMYRMLLSKIETGEK